MFYGDVGTCPGATRNAHDGVHRAREHAEAARARSITWGLSVALAVHAVFASGCGSSSSSAAAPAQTPPIVRTSASRPEIVALGGALFAEHLCERLRGQFLPLGEVSEDEDVKPRGDEPIGGRFWVRQCQTSLNGARVAMSLEGIGWAWVHRGAWGFGLNDYVYFTASGSVVGEVDMSFDGAQQVAWAQFRPVLPPVATGAAIGTVETRANLGGALLHVISRGWAGEKADSTAREKLGAAVQSAFSERLGTGFFVTYDIRRHQADNFGAASLPPLRPFTDGRRWLVNERELLRRAPGGLHILGPFAPTRAGSIDYVVREGSMRYRAECEQDVVAWLGALPRGAAPLLPPPQHTQTGVLGVGTSTVTLGAACPFYVIHEAASDLVTVDVRVRADASGYPAMGL